MSTLIIAILLVGFALLLLGLDLFFPTGGLLLLLSGVLALVGLGFGFAHSAMAGGWLTLLILVSIPMVVFVFVKYYPYTAVGRKMIIERPEPIPFEFRSTRQSHVLAVGDVGIAKTDLQPAGKITIHGTDYEAVSNSGIMNAGTAVEVAEIEMDVAVVQRYDVPIQEARLQVADLPNSINSHSSETDAVDLLNANPDQIDLQQFDTRKDI